MKTTSHGDLLTKITKGGFVKAFRVRWDDGLMLVATMLPKSERGSLSPPQARGAQLVRIALTHSNQRHIGLVDALKVALPDAEVLRTPSDARILTGDKLLETEEAVNGKA